MRVMRLIAVGVVILAACSSETTSLQLSDTRIEIDVFSGRPNPSVQLTPQESQQLESRLADLPPSNTPEPLSRLGYRGFIVHDGGRRIEIGSGRIVVWQGEQRTVYEDSHDAEDWLFKLAVQRGYGSLIATD
jgi:hypothetical protein